MSDFSMQHFAFFVKMGLIFVIATGDGE